MTKILRTAPGWLCFPCALAGVLYGQGKRGTDLDHVCSKTEAHVDHLGTQWPACECSPALRSSTAKHGA